MSRTTVRARRIVAGAESSSGRLVAAGQDFSRPRRLRCPRQPRPNRAAEREQRVQLAGGRGHARLPTVAVEDGDTGDDHAGAGRTATRAETPQADSDEVRVS